MDTSAEVRCPRCGAWIPAQSTEALCPACLLSGALEPHSRDGRSGRTLEADRLRTGFGGQPFPCEFGSYRLYGLLGRGGMGTVYEAEHLSSGRRVALKMLAQQLDSSEMRQRFLREGRLAAGINHPNSLYIFGSEEIEGLPVITMEIAGGGTLQDQLRQQGPLPVPQAVDAILDVIAGLESAYRRGVLHRDVKPSNCFVGPDGTVKVGDFGLSVSMLSQSDSLVTTLGRIMGTPAFASPEQLRGDSLDLRADIYSVGATLFTLLTDRPPFEGGNAVQVVANAVNQKARPLTQLRPDVPRGLERVVARCLAKEPAARYADYAELRHALLPFASREAEPASMKLRAQAGWIDFLCAFLVPYVVLMLAVGSEVFHFQLFLDRTLYSARYYLTFLGLGLVYFALVEGLWGAGLGKRLQGLRVVDRRGRPPGVGRALVRIGLLLLSVEGVRLPLLLLLISASTFDQLTLSEVVTYSIATFLCPWIPVLIGRRVRREAGFATYWDRLSGTRVVIRPQGRRRSPLDSHLKVEVTAEAGGALGPYRILEELVPGQWLVAVDPVLHRRIWLHRAPAEALSAARRQLSRFGRLRWLQRVESAGTAWNAFEAPQGAPFSRLVERGRVVPWATLRHWLHDLATELWSATADRTLPGELGSDHVWITEQGGAVLLDRPWPRVRHPAQRFSMADDLGWQRFLSGVAAQVDTTSLPLHARPVLQNLEAGTFGKLSFLAGILQGLLDKPAEVSRGIRAGAVLLVPLYVWVMFFVGSYAGDRTPEWYSSPGGFLLAPTWIVLGGAAFVQLLELPLRTSVGHSLFRLALVDGQGERAGFLRLAVRWAAAWLPLLLPGALLVYLSGGVATTAALIAAHVALLLWLGAVGYTVFHPSQGLHDRVAGTWVVRR